MSGLWAIAWCLFQFEEDVVMGGLGWVGGEGGREGSKGRKLFGVSLAELSPAEETPSRMCPCPAQNLLENINGRTCRRM